MRTTSPATSRIARIGAALACAVGAATVVATESVNAVHPTAHALHCAMLTMDSHIDVSNNFVTDEVDPGKDGEAQLTLPKMDRGCLDAVFFVAAVGQNKRSAAHYQRAWDEAQKMIAGVHSMARSYPNRVAIARTADDVMRITAKGQHAAVLGLENGYAIGADLSRLPKLFDQGVRYITLTHVGHNAIADSSVPIEELGDAAEEHGGLSEFGRRVIAEMNRLGIIVDVSHTSKKTTLQAIAASRAPVIASHSAVRALADTPRNMDDEQLRLLARRGGVIQVVGYSNYIKLNSAEKNRAIAKVSEELGLAGAMAWAQAPNSTLVAYGHRLVELDRQWPRASVADYVDHIDYIAKQVGIDHVGIGSDFYAGGGAASGGLAGWMDVSEGVHVTEEFLRRGYGKQDIAKIWGGNLLRVMREAEQAAGSTASERTGAVGAVGLKYTTPENVTRLGVIDVGVQGFWQTIFACSVRDIRSVHFIARSDEKSRRFLDAVSACLPSVQLTRCRDVQEVLADLRSYHSHDVERPRSAA